LSTATCLNASAATPDFTGRWKLNVQRSEFGNFLPLTKLTDEITQSETALNIRRTQANEEREVSSEIVYKFGETTVSKLPTGESHTTVTWEGPVMVVDLRIVTSIHLQVVDRWSLSPDGRTLRIVRRYGNDKGSVSQTLILEKE
jgi:hypothetical protein